MIIKTARIVCDRDGCLQFHEGDTGESRATPVVKQARALGWVASDGRQYCPQHVDMADVGAEWWERHRELSGRPCCQSTGAAHHPACRGAS